jgi:hypothetical protein
MRKSDYSKKSMVSWMPDTIARRIGLTLLVVGIGLTPIAMPKVGLVNATPNDTPARRCTPETCTPYRDNYESAIARGIIRRPSSVADVNEAITLADRAMFRGDRTEAAKRLAQALVILSESQGVDSAIAFERTLEADMKSKRRQSLRTALPLFGRIFPLN